MRENDPVYWHEVLESWILTRYDDVLYAIRDKKFSVDRGGSIGKGGSARVKAKLDWSNQFLLQMMVFSDPPRQTLLRNVVVKAFTPQVIEELRGPTELFVQELLDAVRTTGQMEIVRDLALPLPALVTGQMLGLPRERTEDFKRWSFNMFRLFGAGVASDEIVEDAYDSISECKKYFEAIIEERRRRPGEDLISRLVVARDQDIGLTESELAALCVTLMVGAYETTTHLVTNGVYALLSHPEQLKQLRSEPALIDGAIEELLRYIGPALSIVRRATTDVNFGDKTIRADQNIFCMLHAANHDPAQFTEPDRLNIRRTDNRHLGLGHGIHFCLGAALTRLETKIALNAIVHELPELRLPKESPTWMPNLVIRGLKSLHLAFKPQPVHHFSYERVALE
jgi:cytochrome P450